jgi:hypothetical protein
VREETHTEVASPELRGREREDVGVTGTIDLRSASARPTPVALRVISLVQRSRKRCACRTITGPGRRE